MNGAWGTGNTAAVFEEWEADREAPAKRGKKGHINWHSYGNIPILMVAATLLTGARTQAQIITLFDNADSTISQLFSQSGTIDGAAEFLGIAEVTSLPGGYADS